MMENWRAVKKLLEWERVKREKIHRELMRGLYWKFPVVLVLLGFIIWEGITMTMGRALVRLFGGQ